MIIAGIGEVLWDIYPDGRYLGGAVANCIHHVRQLGFDGVLISRVGSDPEGREILRALGKRGIDAGFIQTDRRHPTGYVSVALNERKEPSFTCSDRAAYDFLAWDERFPALIPALDAVLFGTFGQRTEASAATTRRFLESSPHALTVFDVNIRAWNAVTRSIIRACLPLTDVLKMNEDELERVRGLYRGLPGDAAACLRALVAKGNLRLACLTAGSQGCLISDGASCVYSPGFRVDTVDTTGAGDAFTAALTVAYLEGAPLRHTGEFANRAAAFTAARRGATPEYAGSALLELKRERHARIIKPAWEKYMP